MKYWDEVEALCRTKIKAAPEWKIAYVKVTDSGDFYIEGSVTKGVRTRGRLKGNPVWTKPYQTLMLTAAEVDACRAAETTP